MLLWADSCLDLCFVAILDVIEKKNPKSKAKYKSEKNYLCGPEFQQSGNICQWKDLFSTHALATLYILRLQKEVWLAEFCWWNVFLKKHLNLLNPTKLFFLKNIVSYEEPGYKTAIQNHQERETQAKQASIIDGIIHVEET